MKPTKIHENSAAFFTALAHRRRQMLCEILLAHSPKGLSFGALQQKSGLKVSTLTHHLRFMDQGGILHRKQKGSETWISVDIARLHQTSTGFGQTVERTTRKLHPVEKPILFAKTG